MMLEAEIYYYSMFTNRQNSIVIVIFLLACIIPKPINQGMVLAAETNPCQQAQKYFPSSVVEGAIGKKILKTSPTINSCSYNFVSSNEWDRKYNISDGHASLSIHEFKTSVEAKISFNAFKSSKGVEKQVVGGLISINPDSNYGSAWKGNFVFSVNGWVSVRNKKQLSASQIEDLLKYALTQVESGNLSISSVSPNTAYAGTLRFISDSGIADYKNNDVELRISGTGLKYVTFSSDNVGIDKKHGIGFKAKTEASDGTSAKVIMSIRPTTKEGKTTITVTNGVGDKASFEIEITITGTQYLNRNFAGKNVTFYGDWPELAPTGGVIDLEQGILDGLKAISNKQYKELNIRVGIYEKKLWLSKFQNIMCGDKNSQTDKRIVGCTSDKIGTIAVGDYLTGKGGPDYLFPNPWDPSYSIRKATPRDVARMILHESAHRLHARVVGVKPDATFKTLLNVIGSAILNSGFTSEWNTINGNISSCKYLPVVDKIRWSDGTTDPRCGFASPYGASLYGTFKVPSDPSIINSIVKKAVAVAFSSYSEQREDVASMVEMLYFYPERLSKGDGSKDIRYKLKELLLKEFGFL